MIPLEIQEIYKEAGITSKAVAYSIVVKKPKNTITKIKVQQVIQHNSGRKVSEVGISKN